MGSTGGYARGVVVLMSLAVVWVLLLLLDLVLWMLGLVWLLLELVVGREEFW